LNYPAPDALPGSIAPLELATGTESARAYAELTADFNPIHLDPDFAAGTPFGFPIIHGTMALNLVLEAARHSLGPELECRSLEIRFSAPCPVGETILAAGMLSDPASGTYDIFVETRNGVRTLQGTMVVGRVQ
jgi:acyl dehydratase